MRSPFEIFCLLCTTVRAEANGQTSIIGIFPSVHRISAYPTLIPAGIYLRMKPMPPSGIDVNLQVRAGERTLFSIDSVTPDLEEADEPGSSLQLTLDGLLLEIIDDEPIEVWSKIGEADWTKLTSCKIQSTEKEE